MSRAYLFWGSLLILLGGLLFVNAAGISLPGGVQAMQLFWPSALILFGVWVLLSTFWRGGAESKPLAIDLQAARQASLKLDYGACNMRLAEGAPANQLLSGNVSGRIEQSASLYGETLDVQLGISPDWMFPFGGDNDAEWELLLNRNVPISLRIHSGAAKSEINLRDLLVTDLELSTGASKTDLTLPAAAGTTTVKVELGAASLDIVVPQQVAARVRVEQGAAAIEVDTRRFPYANGIYESADFSMAQNRADITVQAGAGKVAVH